MKVLLTTLSLLAFAAPAFAQSSDAQSRALQMTVNELTQAWVGARAALLANQDQLAAANTKIHDLEAKLPRQVPIPSPSGVSNAPIPSDEAPK